MIIWIMVFYKEKTPYDMRIRDWSSDVCSSDLDAADLDRHRHFDRDIAQQFGIRDRAEADPAHRQRQGGARLRHRLAIALITARPSPAKEPSSIASPPPRPARWRERQSVG